MRDGGYHKTDQNNDVHCDHAANLRVIASDRGSEIQKGSDADEAADNRRGPQRGPEYRKQHEASDQAEQNGTMAHQDCQVGLAGSDAIQGRKLLASEHSGQGEQMNDAGY